MLSFRPMATTTRNAVSTNLLLILNIIYHFQTVLTAGLLAELMRREEALRDDSITSPLATSKLYENAKSLSTISGGSWFTSYLVYSENYRRMVEEMANQAATGADKGIVSGTFYEKYGKRFDDLKDNSRTTNDIQVFFQNLESFIAPLGDIPLVGVIFEQFKRGLKTAVFFSQIGSDDGGTLSNWYSITKTILGDDINQKTLGSDVQEWAKGKNWNIITSVTTPITSVTTPSWSSPSLVDSTIWADENGFKNLRYSAEIENNNIFGGLFVPVLFSAVLGNEGSPPAPLPESVYSLLKKISLTYKGRKPSFSFFPPFFSLKIFGPQRIERGIQPRMNDNKSFSDMPIVGPVAASSAAIGFASILPTTISSVLSQTFRL